MIVLLAVKMACVGVVDTGGSCGNCHWWVLLTMTLVGVVDNDTSGCC